MTRLCGRTLPPSMANRGVAEWIASLGVSPVSPSALRESGKPKRTTAGSGRILAESFARWDPDTCSWRTCQVSLFTDLEMFSETWPTAGSIVNGMCLVQPNAERRTSDGECSSWPTATSRDWKDGNDPTENVETNSLLGRFAPRWPTPTDTDSKGRGYTYDSADKTKPRLSLTGHSLHHRATQTDGPTSSSGGPNSRQRWNTPRNEDSREANQPRKRRGKMDPPHLCAQVRKGAKRLNPQFVEWLMGLPLGWTALEPVGTESFLSWRRMHFSVLRSVLENADAEES